MTLGQNIALARKKKGISQEELSNQLNVSRQSVSLWETNQTVPTIEKLKELSILLDVGVDHLLGLQKEEKEAMFMIVCLKYDEPCFTILPLLFIVPDSIVDGSNPAKAKSWLGLLNLFMSPTSATKEAADIIPTPLNPVILN